MHPHVVGVRVDPVAGVADDHLRPLPPDDLDQAAGGVVEVGVGEVVGVGVRLGVGHARVAVAEQVQLVVADDAHRVVELPQPDRGQVGAHVVGVGRGVEDVAGLAAGAGDEHRAHALGVVPGHRGRALRRFVVGVGVHGQHARARCGEPADPLPSATLPRGPGRHRGPFRLRLTDQAVAAYTV